MIILAIDATVQDEARPGHNAGKAGPGERVTAGAMLRAGPGRDITMRSVGQAMSSGRGGPSTAAWP